MRVGLRDRLREFLDRGGVVIGASGGAMLLAQNVALFRLEGGTLADAVANPDALKAMGFIDYEILPHANRFDAALLGQLSTYARRVDCDVLALNDGAAVIHTTATHCRCVGAVAWYTKHGAGIPHS